MISIECPINNLSFGNVSVCILSELKKRGHEILVKLIGDRADMSNLSEDNPLPDWIEDSAKSFDYKHSRNTPILKIWHIRDSLKSYSEKQGLFTFHELDSITKTEKNILRNQNVVFVSSKYTKKVFEDEGLSNVIYAPLGFDTSSFHKKEVKRPSAEVVFAIVGKLEKRKAHHKVLRAWAKKYGNNKKYALNCAIQNPFIDPQQQSQAIMNILEGKKYYNINFLGFMQTNSLYNEFLNVNDIVIGMSHAEGFGLPEFQSVCLGKHAVILNAHSYKDWANKENAVMVEPTEKIDSEDSVFFIKGSEYNQGRYFDWDEDEFIFACEKAEARFYENQNNDSGEKLKEEFTYQRTVDILEKEFLK